jgi:hypothetical protein
MGPIISTIIGAAIKLAANLINHWLEMNRASTLLNNNAESETIKALISNQEKQASDPFVKVTRRILFLMITGTYCFLMTYYAFHPDIEYSILVPEKSSGGFFGLLFGSDSYSIKKLTGGLMLASFIDLVYMVVGFYAIPSKRR